MNPRDEAEQMYREREAKSAYANLGKACEPPSSPYPTMSGASTGGYNTATDSAGQMTTQSQPPGGMLNERLSLHNIDDAMRYQPWTRDQQDAGEQVREVLTQAAKTILRTVPDGPFRSVALRNILDARMNANAAISFRGRF